MEFDWVARFHETILTVKSVLSSEIYEISSFQLVLQGKITVLPFSLGFTRMTDVDNPQSSMF